MGERISYGVDPVRNRTTPRTHSLKTDYSRRCVLGWGVAAERNLAYAHLDQTEIGPTIPPFSQKTVRV